MLKRVLIIAGLFCFMSSAANADQTLPPQSLSNGFYVEPMLGYAKVNIDQRSSKNTGITVGARVGWQLTDQWGINTSYTHFSVHHQKANIISLAARYRYPIHKATSIFGLIGAAYKHGARHPNSGNHDNITPLLGVGILRQLDIRMAAVLQGEFTTHTSTLPSTVGINIGLDYFF